MSTVGQCEALLRQSRNIIVTSVLGAVGKDSNSLIKEISERVLYIGEESGYLGVTKFTLNTSVM